MNAVAAIESWVATPAAHALGRTLLHFLWEGAMAAGLLTVLLAIVRSPRARYVLAVAALLALPLAFAVTWTICARPAGALLPAPHAPALYRLPIALPVGNSLPTPPPDRFTWLVPLWMAGVAISYARSFAGWFAAQRLRCRGVCAAPEFWQERLRTLSARLRISRPVLLLESCLAEVPVTFGWFRPVILLPIGLFAGLPTDQAEAILLHELAHIRRADYAVNLLATFVEGLLFYHPAVWWISRVVRAERENCCDDAVIAQNTDARSYAAALARLEHNRSLAREAVLAANGGNLMNRIRRLLNQPERPRTLAAPAIALGLLLVTVAAALAWTPTPQSRRELVRQTLANTYEQLPLKNYMSFLAFVPQQAVPQPPQRKKDAGGDATTLLGQAQQSEQQRRDAVVASLLYSKWLNEDVAYIITAEERADFKKLQTNDEREKFIEQFWLRRDPTPGTPENEFKEEHYRRIAYANQHFSSSIPGWKTDRGRIYIIYGPPDEIDDHSNETAKAPFQLWRYRFIEGVGQNVIIQFTDTGRNGEYRMDSDPGLLGRSASRSTVHVGLNGAVTFGVPVELAAQAYTGTWTVSRQGEDRVLAQGPFDSRFGGQTTLQPGAYTLHLNLHDPNGKPFTSDVSFSVD